MASFVEVFKCSGVDEKARPDPGMVVLFRDSNVVALTDGQGLRVDSPNKGIKIEEIADPTPLVRERVDQHNKLAQPGVDSQMRDSLMPEIIAGQPRYFRIYGKALIGPPGALVQASSAHKVEAQLRVLVFDEKKRVKLSIRNVQVPDASGNKVFHAKNPCDPQKECDQMNLSLIHI